jgi:hypothetical protein
MAFKPTAGSLSEPYIRTECFWQRLGGIGCCQYANLRPLHKAARNTPVGGLVRHVRLRDSGSFDRQRTASTRPDRFASSASMYQLLGAFLSTCSIDTCEPRTRFSKPSF